MTSIAIIGIGCRFPQASNPELFWELLSNGKDAITEIGTDRRADHPFYRAIAQEGGTSKGGFLENVDGFEAEFFQISPREAEQIDPQQRLLLEVTWEAMENAGLVPSQLGKSNTGVFIGISNGDYQRLIEKDYSNINAYSGTGTAFCVAANRLSYFFNLKSPSLAIDTACSSSLVALHQACQSLQLNESDLCIAGGVNLILSPEATLAFSSAKMMSSDGRCKTFDASADGYVRGEGCGVVILKRLEDAIADGDNIQAIIRGTAVNQDGLTNGLTAPNGLSQQAVIRQALKNAGVSPSQISYVETHGTGTILGDPIEIKALKAVLLEGRSLDRPCWFGSVKTNIGHLESAAGMASLIKVILSLQHREIPPHLHLKELNPYISFEGTPFSIPTRRQPWDTGQGTRLAGVSSFGFGGTNAHVILEEAPQARQQTVLDRSWHLFTLSSKSQDALRDLVKDYIRYLMANPSVNLADICWTLSTGRTHFNHRLAVVTQTTQQLQQQLVSYCERENTIGLFSGESRKKSPKIAFLFTGQGSQYIGMGRELYGSNYIFKQTFDRCDAILRPYLERSLAEILYTFPDEASLNQTLYTQPALFALEYALFQVWRSWGIQPTAVMGHSVGEYVAACVAGVFSLEDGLKFIARRAQLAQNLTEKGSMLAVMADERIVGEVMEKYSLSLDIAAINYANNTVISGKHEDIEIIQTLFKDQGIRTKTLTVSHAFHSRLMEPLLNEFTEIARQITYHQPNIALISNLTGDLVTDEIATPEYWCRHLMETVRFWDSIIVLQQQGYEIFIEVGAKPILLGMGRRCVSTDDGYWLPSLRPEQNDWQQLLESLANLYIAGVSVDWKIVNRDYASRRLPLPTYPFQRKRYWIETQRKTTPENSLLLDSPVLNLIQQGKTEQLSSLLQTDGQFSHEELRFLPKFLNSLVQHHQQQIHRTLLEEWLYQIEWREKPLVKGNSRTNTGTWLIFADTQGLGKELARQLQEKGNICFVIYPDEFYQFSHAMREGRLEPSRQEDFEKLWLDLDGQLDGMVYLWGLETASNEQITAETLEEAQVLTCYSLLYILQSLSNLHSFELWLVSRGGISINHSAPHIAQSPLWGIAKVITWEYPQLCQGIIDLDPNSSDITQLITEIENPQSDARIAFRDGRRFVSRLVKTQCPPTKNIILDPNRTYLVTGGLGALGLKITQWLINKGVQYIVLIGRNQPSSEVQTVLSLYQQQEIYLQIIQGDITNLESLSQVFEMIEISMPPLAGIFHTAGILDDAIIAEQTIEKFQRVMSPKVQGSWNLHQLTEEIQLDFFVAFSSLVSVMGSLGQSNYAAANLFMDSLMHYRNSLGLPGLSINWGLWDAVGMAASLEISLQNRLKEQGLQFILPEQGLYILEQLLGVSGQVGAFSINWSMFQKQLLSEGIISFLSDLLSLSVSENRIYNPEKQTLLQKMLITPNEQLYSVLFGYLQEEISRVLRLSVAQIKEDELLNSLGIDSLMAVELRNQIMKDLNVQLAIEQILDETTLGELTEFLLKQITLRKINTQDTDINDEEEMEEIVI